MIVSFVIFFFSKHSIQAQILFMSITYYRLKNLIVENFLSLHISFINHFIQKNYKNRKMENNYRFFILKGKYIKNNIERQKQTKDQVTQKSNFQYFERISIRDQNQQKG
ncbi:unnamed protein product [Paramecium sonneborni]|uniref:Transmembrane protein n=1 Tax=Paramecium sonneborni TaxID=65129 RepID=A0A8S1PSW1_9CILI|nr:unnamed protein product [Paramecium sonneborni]